METTAAGTKRSDPMYRLSENVRSAGQADSGVVLDIGRGRMFRLNDVGLQVLELLKSGLQEPEIVDRITTEFGVGFETAAHDAREFFEGLNRLGLIEDCAVEAANAEDDPT